MLVVPLMAVLVSLGATTRRGIKSRINNRTAVRKSDLSDHTPNTLNYYVSAEMYFRGKYRECPPFQKLKCRQSKCIHMACDKAKTWSPESCNFLPIDQCESTDWLCDCDNSLGYFRLNTSTTECVHEDSIDCQKAQIQCKTDEAPVCPSDDCNERDYWNIRGYTVYKKPCSSDKEEVRQCKEPLQCHCRYPLLRYGNSICINYSDIFCPDGIRVCTDHCQIKECITRHPDTSQLCQHAHSDETLYNCTEPPKCKCKDNKLFFLHLSHSRHNLLNEHRGKDYLCAQEKTCDYYKYFDKGTYHDLLYVPP